MPMTLHQWATEAATPSPATFSGPSGLGDVLWDIWTTPRELRDKHWSWGTALPQILDMIPRVSRSENHVSLSNKLRWFCLARKFGLRWKINTKIRLRVRLGILALLRLRVLPRSRQLLALAHIFGQFLMPNDLPREWRRLHAAA